MNYHKNAIKINSNENALHAHKVNAKRQELGNQEQDAKIQLKSQGRVRISKVGLYL